MIGNLQELVSTQWTFATFINCFWDAALLAMVNGFPETDLLNYSLSRKHELNVPLFQGSDRREEDQNPFVGD